MKKLIVMMMLTFLPLVALAQGNEGDNQGDAQFNMVHPDIVVPPQSESDRTGLVVVMGVEVQAMSGLLEVTNDVNVRKGPDTHFDRVAGLKAGERVRAVGRPKGTKWIAVSKGGETLGFVYDKMLTPVVDGTLKEQFLGAYTSNNPDNGNVACDYRFRFEGKNQVEGADFDTSDYEVRFRCASSKGAAIFYAHMYLTEAPVNERTGRHLIGIEVRSIGDGLEEYLKTRYRYVPKTGNMKFNGHSLPKFAIPPKVQSFKTKSIKDALKQALEASIASWTPLAWESLFSKSQKIEQ